MKYLFIILLLVGCKEKKDGSRQYVAPLSLEDGDITELQDSFYVNYHKEILSDPKCKRDSGFYYRGRADAFLDLTHKLPK